MDTLNVSSFIWGIADDVLRDVYVRGKYRDVILPMTVIRRLDAVLENVHLMRCYDFERSALAADTVPAHASPGFGDSGYGIAQAALS